MNFILSINHNWIWGLAGRGSLVESVGIRQCPKNCYLGLEPRVKGEVFPLTFAG